MFFVPECVSSMFTQPILWNPIQDFINKAKAKQAAASPPQMGPPAPTKSSSSSSSRSSSSALPQMGPPAPEVVPKAILPPVFFNDPLSKSIRANQAKTAAASSAPVFDLRNLPVSKEGDYQSEPGGPIKTGGVTYETVSKQEGLSIIYNQAQKLQDASDKWQAVSKNPFSNNLFGQPMFRGMSQVFANRLSVQSQELQQLANTGSSEWHPQTKVGVSYDLATREPTSFDLRFPYAGAEKYGSTREAINRLSPEQRLLFGLTSVNPANVPMALSTGQSKLDLEVKAYQEMQGWYGPKGEMNLGGFAQSYIASPVTSIGLMFASAGAYGAASGAAKGALLTSGSLKVLNMVNTSEAVIGVGLGVYSGLTLKKTFEEQGMEAGAGQGWLLGAQFGAGMAGYGMGAAAGTRYGAQKGFEKFLSTEYKASKIDITTYSAGLEGSRARYQLDKFFTGKITEQPVPKFTDIQSMADQPGLRSYFQNKLPTIKHEIFGGAATNKPMGTHDLDVMLGPRNYVYAEYASSKVLKIGSVKDFADIKPFQRPGSIVSEFGTMKMRSLDIEGYNVMRYSEQFSRLSGSSFRPAHSGRLKDLPESMRMLDELVAGTGKGTGSAKLNFNISSYKNSIRYLESLGEKNPLIRSQAESDLIYGPSLGKRFYEFRMKAWERILPESFKRSDAMRFIGGGKGKGFSDEGFLPASPRSNLISSRFSMSLGGGVISRMISSSMKVPKSSFSSSFLSRSFGLSMKMPSISKKSMSLGSTGSSWSSFFGSYPSFSPSSIGKSGSGWSDIPSPSSPSNIPSSSLPSISSLGGSLSLSLSSSYKSISDSYSNYPSLSPSAVYGGWGEWADEWFYGKKKRYRSTKTYDPLKELFGM